MQFCNDCGAQNPDGGKFCNQCGAALAVSAGAPTLPVSPPLASAPPIAAGLPNIAPAPSPAPPAAAGVAAGTTKPAQQTVALNNALHGRYVVLKLLAQGGMGAVYLAQDSSVFNRLLVVKEMLRYYTTAEEQKQAEYAFEREARLLANLSNPGIPKIFDYFIENGNYYLVMEFAEGENLQDRMARLARPMSEVEVLPIAVQMANILVYTARQNPPVIHRDIKPANVIIGPEEQVRLVDFGIAKTTAGAGATTGLTAPVGTPGYAPPEQYQGQTQPRTDIYALGALLHYLLTGRDPSAEMPFSFPPVRSLAPHISPPLEALIGEMLCMDALQRPDAVQLRARLEALSPQATSPSPGFQPFVFRAGAIAGNLHELAQACDKHWDEAVEHLYNGDFESWLNLAGRPDLAKRADTIRRHGGDSSLGLEEFIRAIDHTMLMPSLAVDQAVLQLGPVQRGEKRAVAVRLMNAGRGYLSGQINNASPWVRVAPRSFGLRQGQQVQLGVTIDTAGWPEGSFGQTAFMADSTGGQAVVTVAADVTWPPELGIEPAGMLDFGAVAEGEARAATTTFRVRNVGGGTLDGALVSACPWINLDQSSFSLVSGQELVVTATADPAFIGSIGPSSPAGQGAGGQGLIQIVTPAGTRDAPARIRVQKQWYTGAPRTSAWLGHGLLALLGYLGLAIPLGALMAILLGWPEPGVRGLLLLGALLVASGPAFMAARSWTARLDEIEDFHHRGRLADELVDSRYDVRKLGVLGVVGLVFGALLGYHFGRYAPAGSPGGWLALGAAAGGLGGALLAAEGVRAAGGRGEAIIHGGHGLRGGPHRDPGGGRRAVRRDAGLLRSGRGSESGGRHPGRAGGPAAQQREPPLVESRGCAGCCKSGGTPRSRSRAHSSAPAWSGCCWRDSP